MPADATGPVIEASTPTRVNGIAPATRRQRHPTSACVPAGTTSCRHTTDNSSPVRVTLNTSPAVAHAGTAEPGGSLQTANRPVTPSSVSGRVADPFPGAALSEMGVNATDLTAASLTVSRNTSGRA